MSSPPDSYNIDSKIQQLEKITDDIKVKITANIARLTGFSQKLDVFLEIIKMRLSSDEILTQEEVDAIDTMIIISEKFEKGLECLAPL
jgi:hypothetical protein